MWKPPSPKLFFSSNYYPLTNDPCCLGNDFMESENFSPKSNMIFKHERLRSIQEFRSTLLNGEDWLAEWLDGVLKIPVS